MSLTHTSPQFLGIGAQKAGTTWLHQHLARHPKVWLPPIKEVHYFDRKTCYPSPNFLSVPYSLERFFGRTHVALQFRRRLKSSLLQAIKGGEWTDVFWMTRFAFGRYNDEWYLSMFQNRGEDKVTGEITPSYSFLNWEDVMHIAHLLPNAKIIFIMRNPVERAWSHMRYVGLGKAPLDRQIEFIESPAQVLRSDYVHTIETWSSIFNETQLHFEFFDNIVKTPKELLRKICFFLSITPYPHWLDSTALAPVFQTADRSVMPKALENYLYQKYRPQMETLATRFGEPVLTWLSNARC